jgi:hypothetical protein
LPKKTWSLKGERCRDGKDLEETLTVFICDFAVGDSENLWL